MAGIPFVAPIDPLRYAEVEQVSPRVRRIIARNPSKFTFTGTGTYIVGHGEVAVIDPGPVLDAHRDALMAELIDEKVVAILVTHCHSDHSPLAAWLREYSGAPTYAFGPHGAVDDYAQPTAGWVKIMTASQYPGSPVGCLCTYRCHQLQYGRA